MAKKDKAEAGDAGVDIFQLRVPLAREVVGNVPHKIEGALYTASARLGLARLRQGLAEAGTMRAGVAIESNADAVRWLLEQLGGAD